MDESKVQALLDTVYSSPVSDWWRDEVLKAADAFKTEVLSNLYPFESDDRLEEKFCEMFDGQEVLPMGLYEEYMRLSQTESILTQSLLVPLSRGQFWRLRREDCLEKVDQNIWGTHVPYDSCFGLQLHRQSLDESE